MNKNVALLLAFISWTIHLCALDPSFGTGGVQTQSILRNDTIYSSLIQTNSRIVVAGSAASANAYRGLVARFNTNGSLDTTFNTVGYQTSLIGSHTEAYSCALQSDGKIIAAGYAMESLTNVAVMRYLVNGAPDTTFNGTGFVTTSVGTGAAAFSVKIQSGGKIVVGGTSIFDQAQFMLIQYDTDGSQDTFFGANGVVLTPIDVQASVSDIAIQSDGKIVAVGYASDGTFNKFALVRYNANGTLDTSFGGGGVVTWIVGTNAFIKSVALQPDNKIVVAGYAQLNGIYQFVVARFNTDGSLDTTFNGTGMRLTNIQDFSQASAVVVQPDGKIVAGGLSVGNASTQFALVRYLSNGLLDETFGNNGIMLTTIPLNSTDSESAVLSLSLSSYILAAGVSNQDLALAAYTY